MASTITLGRSVTYVQRFIRNAPLTFTNNGEPAFSSADWVREFILAPPFAWRWNRAYVSPISCVLGVSDYQANVPDFGWIEKASLSFPVVQGSPPRSIELEVGMVFAGETFTNEPAKISAQLDDDNGNITFRIFPPPDQQYLLSIVYQKASPTFSSLLQSWAPIPDYMSYLYHQGLKAIAYEYMGDERFGFSIQLFLQQLVSASENLSETQKNIFLKDRMDTLREQISVQSGKR